MHTILISAQSKQIEKQKEKKNPVILGITNNSNSLKKSKSDLFFKLVGSFYIPVYVCAGGTFNLGNRFQQEGGKYFLNNKNS